MRKSVDYWKPIIAYNLRRICAEKDTQPGHVAAQLDPPLKRQSMSGYANGTNAMSAPLLKEIADCLKVNINQFFKPIPNDATSVVKVKIGRPSAK